uniref:protein PML-like n=1 Tax=Euleptes europaea TaxID=460621 RepID=UPI00254133F3|nr:protein PML-like [Euleptes europaea]
MGDPEARAQGSAGASAAPAQNLDVDEEFQFLLCENCRKEVECPKLLPCLHNVCPDCLQETKPMNCCPVCQAPHSQTDATSVQDNSLFANLRAKLSIFRRIQSGQELFCDNCKKEGTHWCSDCREFLCSPCFESHQRYSKRESHEARALKELRADSSQEFLGKFKKTAVMFCSNADHGMQNLSIYCKDCKRAMCCVCALLDSQHNGHHCHIREEIQRWQKELLDMSTELKEKKTSYDGTCSNLREMVNHMVEEKNKTKELIQQKVAEMVRLVQEKGEELLAAVDRQHQREVQDTEEKLRNVEGVTQRMASCKQLVEKMHLYASEQEVMDMYPFIRESLEELKRKQPPVVETQIQVGNFAQVEARLQAFYRRVTDENEASPARVITPSNQELLGKLPAKRSMEVQTLWEPGQTPIKWIKIEGNDDGWKLAAGQVNLEQPGTSSGDCPAENRGSLWKGEDTEIISGVCFSISSPESSNTDAPSCLNGCAEDASSDDIELLDPNWQEDTGSESGHDDYWRNVFRPPKRLFSGQGSLVFFDMKVLSESIVHLVAVADEDTSFSVLIQPLFSSPRGEFTGGHCEVGLESFLRYLLTLHQPILVGYDLWSMDFAVLENSLRAIQKEEAFKAAVFGFLDALPLIKERVPDLSNYTLSSLDSRYFWGKLDDSQAGECAKTVKDLCTVLEVNPGVDRRLVTYSNLHTYGSLQPLLQEGILSNSTIQTLALNGVCLSTLLSVYRKDPAHGLQKFGRYLNSRWTSGGETIQQLSKAWTYFEALLSTSQGSESLAAKSGKCSSH